MAAPRLKREPWLERPKRVAPTPERYPARAAAIVAWKAAGGSGRAARIVRMLNVFHGDRLTVDDWKQALEDAEVGKYDPRDGFDPAVDVVRVKTNR